MSLFTQFLKPVLCVLLGISFPLTCFSQIQGSVKDINNLPVSYANILLLNQKDSIMVSGIIATEEGTFSISNFSPGTYLLGVSLLGYKRAYSPPFVIKSSNDHLHLNPIIVEEDVFQLGDVEVVAKNRYTNWKSTAW